MITDQLINDLRQIVGDAQVSVSRAGTELYSYDASLAKGQPGVVVFPGNTHEAAQIVKITRQADIPFVPRGFGTNLSGGTVLVPGGVTLPPVKGEDLGKVQSLPARFARGEITLEYAQEVACTACATPGGSCQFLGTAATSQVISEPLYAILSIIKPVGLSLTS